MRDRLTLLRPIAPLAGVVVLVLLAMGGFAAWADADSAGRADPPAALPAARAVSFTTDTLFIGGFAEGNFVDALGVLASDLSGAEREMIVVAVSRINACTGVDLPASARSAARSGWSFFSSAIVCAFVLASTMRSTNIVCEGCRRRIRPMFPDSKSPRVQIKNDRSCAVTLSRNFSSAGWPWDEWLRSR